MVRSINNIINLFAKSLSANVWILLPAMAINSCDSIQTSQEISTSNSAVAVQIIKVSPMSAKPNETLSLSGTGFNTVKNPTVRLTMSDGSVKKTIAGNKIHTFADNDLANRLMMLLIDRTIHTPKKCPLFLICKDSVKVKEYLRQISGND
jgi:hypothetical protein